jgi:hypothetical protein
MFQLEKNYVEEFLMLSVMLLMEKDQLKPPKDQESKLKLLELFLDNPSMNLCKPD